MSLCKNTDSNKGRKETMLQDWADVTEVRGACCPALPVVADPNIESSLIRLAPIRKDRNGPSLIRLAPIRKNRNGRNGRKRARTHKRTAARKIS
jgi:hypothetical protein